MEFPVCRGHQPCSFLCCGRGAGAGRPARVTPQGSAPACASATPTAPWDVCASTPTAPWDVCPARRPPGTRVRSSQRPPGTCIRPPRCPLGRMSDQFTHSPLGPMSGHSDASWDVCAATLRSPGTHIQPPRWPLGHMSGHPSGPWDVRLATPMAPGTRVQPPRWPLGHVSGQLAHSKPALGSSRHSGLTLTSPPGVP